MNLKSFKNAKLPKGSFTYMDGIKIGEQRDWQDLIAILNQHSTFVFSTHLEPDADGVGAELGLARYLKSIGKTVHILNPSPLRANLHFLPNAHEIQVYDPEEHAEFISTAHVFLAFDVGHYNRLKQLCPALESSQILKISIDHHPGEKGQFDYRFDFPTASSTGILIYDLLRNMDNACIDNYSIAFPLYAAMMSDTGNFRFNNTDPETFFAAGRLVAAGVKPYELYVKIYEDLNTPGRLQIFQRLLRELKYDCNGRLAWSVIDFEEVQGLGAKSDDLHSLSDFIRSIKGVEIGVSITKMPGQTTDISFRSKGTIPINEVAMTFNGGGHAFAAGCRIDGPLDSAVEAVIAECRQTIANWDKRV